MNFKRNIDYIKTAFILKMKAIKEYKINLYFAFLANFTFLIFFAFVLFVLKLSFSDIFYWSVQEFIFFGIFTQFIVFIFEPICRIDLKIFLLRGDFNTFLSRPINSFSQYTMNSSIFFTSFLSVAYLFLLILFLIFIYPQFVFYKLIVTFFFGFLGGLFHLFIVVFFRSLTFFFKEAQIIFKTYKRSDVFFIYPATFFKDSKFEKLIFIFPVTYFGAFATEYFFGLISFLKLLSLSFLLIVFILILGFLSFILWKKGIEKYEAFG